MFKNCNTKSNRVNYLMFFKRHLKKVEFFKEKKHTKSLCYQFYPLCCFFTHCSSIGSTFIDSNDFGIAALNKHKKIIMYCYNGSDCTNHIKYNKYLNETYRMYVRIYFDALLKSVNVYVYDNKV